MAKKQSFSDKTGKKAASKNRIKLVRSVISEKTGSVRFFEDVLPVPEGKTPEATIKDFIASK
ncbi:MAG: hypothetical protein CMG39_04205 [Candidatus Marinimicrobia bacterium]|nr:hypothetical protein [Candidatus Neomarinimicrobiota bacterium]|tara:strand:+ start:1419 stop:1604 length:186 start_codon:yes stop_codon:yes gene_type:complete